MVAKDIMTRKVKTVLPELRIKEFAEFLIKEKISGAPVTDKAGSFLGIATEEDLIFQDKKPQIPTFLNFFSNIFPLGMNELEQELRKIAGVCVKDVMQKKPLTIREDTTVEEIATLMTETKTYYLPVVEDGKITGVITKRDLIRAVAKGKIW